MAETDSSTTSTSTENSEATQAADKAKAGTTDRLFTQADLDKKIAERISREKATAATAAAKAAEDAAAEAVRQFREENGLDEEAMEQIKGRDQAAAQARQLKAEKTKAENLAKTLETKHQRAIATLDREMCSNQILKELTAAECCDTESAVALLRPKVKLLEVDGEFQAVVVNDKGEPTSMTIAEAVNQLLTRKPNLKAAKGNFQGSGSRVTEGQSADTRGREAWRTAEGRKQSLASLVQDAPRPASTLTSR